MGLARRLSAFAEVRRGEGLKTALMFLYFFLLMASYYVIKPVRNSLFLEHLGPEQLPYVYLATAAIIGVVAAFYTWLLARFERHLLIAASSLFFCLNLLLFWWFFRLEVAWMAALFYLWAAVFSVGAVTQFWSIANEIFNPEEAKRLFGLVGSGGIAGGIVGGLAANLLVRPLGTENLLLVSAAVLAPCAGVAAAIHRLEERLSKEAAPVRRAEPPPAAHEATARSVMATPYLRLLALMMIVMVVVATLVDYGFNTVAAHSFAGKDVKTAFFGVFFAGLGGLSLLIQLFLTSPLLRGLGVGAALLLLPVSLGAASLSGLLVPALWSASALKLADGSLRYSLNQSTREILFLPVPLAQKYAAKAFIDVSLQRWARGGAALLILATIALGLPWTALVLVTALFCAAWVGLVLRTKGLYLHSLRRLLDEPARPAPELADHGAGGWPSLSRRGAAALAAAAGPKLRLRLLGAPDPRVRLEALAALAAAGEVTERRELERLLEDADPAVRELAWAGLCAQKGGDTCTLAERARWLLARGGEEGRVRAARLIGALGGPEAALVAELARLLTDDSFEVRRGAAQAAATLREPRLIPALVHSLSLPCQGEVATEALIRCGPQVAGHLAPVLLGEGCGRTLAERSCQVLAAVGGREAARVLEAALGRPHLAPIALRALASLDSSLELPPGRAEEGFRRSLRRWARLLVVAGDYETLRRGPSRPPDLLSRALLAAQREALEAALLWQGLSRDRALALRSVRGLGHWAKELQAASRELLESGLPREARRLLAVVLSGRGAAEKARAAVPLAGVARRHFFAWLPELLSDPDPGVRLGAVQALATHPPAGFRAELARLARRGGPEGSLALAALSTPTLQPQGGAPWT